MQYHDLTRRLFGSPARAAVTAAILAAPDQEYTGRDVARMAGVSPARAMDALSILEAEGVCWRRVVGRANLWRVDRRHFLAEALGAFASLEQRALAELLGVLQDAVRGAGATEAYLFGSVACGNERATSDIDIVAVFPDERRKRAWQDRLPALQDKVQWRFANELQAIAYTRASIRRGGPRRVFERARAEGRPLLGGG